jgi:hypothetical protein
MSSSDERWEAEQQQLLDARNHLASCQQWAQNALSMAENDGREQAAAAIFAQVATAKAIAALAAAALEIAGSIKASPPAPSS